MRDRSQLQKEATPRWIPILNFPSQHSPIDHFLLTTIRLYIATTSQYRTAMSTSIYTR